jgi:hypothetical protein
MGRQDRKLLTPAEFAEAVGVQREVVQARLNGHQRDYWRGLLGVEQRGSGSRRGRLLIPADSVAIWRNAVPLPAARKRTGKVRSGQPQGREAKARQARVGLNEILMVLARRAETVDTTVLRRTFVDAGQLRPMLCSPNHQVIFGRRGTGKTHALAMVAAHMADEGDVVVSIDLRRVGSTGAYASRTTPLPQRGTQLLVDLLVALHDHLVELALTDDDPEAEGLLPVLDRLADVMSTVQVVGMVERESSAQHTRSDERGGGAGVTLGAAPGLSLSANLRQARSTVFERRIVESGAPQLDLSFGAIARTFEDVTRCLEPRRLWVLIDEWSSVPIELQPILADFLRRALLAVPGVVVKIAAIEDRSHFRVPTEDGDNMGLELGADIAADVTLDDFMIFDNDDNLALRFFSSLLHQHVAAHLLDRSQPHAGELLAADAEWARHLLASADAFVKAAFTNALAFRELVRAAEGVPRDAINLASLAAGRAAERTIGVSEVKAAARDWYQRDKEGALRRPEARELLAAIVDEVVGRRKARAFLLERGSRGSEDFGVRELYDARILHLVKRGIPAPHRPSLRYDGFVLDYGCYVDFSLPGYAGSSELWRAGVPPDHFAKIESSVLDLAALRR